MIGHANGARIGLLGGIGPAATTLYYDLLVREGRNRTGHTPELVIHSLDFEWFTWLEEHDAERYIDEIRRGMDVLVAGGADILAMAANSPHTVFPAVAPLARRRVVHIVESVARAARAAGVERALLLGIPVTMRSTLYPDILGAEGVQVQVPAARHHARIRSIVFDELTYGIQAPSSRAWLLDLLAEHDVDALILGCTELSLLIEADDTPVLLLDSTRLHVDAILDAASATNGEEP